MSALSVQELEDEVHESDELMRSALGSNGKPRDDETLRAAAERILKALNKLEPLDPDVYIEEYAGQRSEAEDALLLTGGAAALCSLTGKPRAELTDMGNAVRFAADHADAVRYVPGPRWHAWDGRRWATDTEGAVMRAAKGTVRGIREEAKALEDPDLAKKVFGHAIASQSRRGLEATIKLAESELGMVVESAALDADPNLFNVQNGTLDLRTGELRPHDRADLLTKLAPVTFDDGARCPRWDEFLQTVLAGEAELIEFLQTAVGYTLTGHTSEQCMMLLTGDGANGKSTFLEVVGAMAGDYADKADSSTFMARSAQAGSARPDLARLRGARYVHAAEVEQGARFAEVFVKQATGGDTLVARPLYKDEFEFQPQFTIWIGANSRPEIRGTDHAIWRRIREVPFTVKITKPDKRLPEKLRAELPGILNWALAGCKRWYADGLPLPDAVRVATQDYRTSQDTVGQFIEACCQLHGEASIAAAELYEAYSSHCTEEGLEPLARPQFKAALQARGIVQRRDKHGLRWVGIGAAR